jgi:hypothetical protein
MTAQMIIDHIVSTLDTVKLPYQTYKGEAKKLIGLKKEDLAVLYDSIPKEENSPYRTRGKCGKITIISDKGYEYQIIAVYSIYDDRSSANEEIIIERRIPDEGLCSKVYLYYKEIKAPPVTGDKETIAKRIISRLYEEVSEEDRWTPGVSLKAEARALFELIPKKSCDNPSHTSYDKGSMTVVTDDGLEYLFTAESSSDCGGSEWYDRESLSIECSAIGLKRLPYSYSHYSR